MHDASENCASVAAFLFQSTATSALYLQLKLATYVQWIFSKMGPFLNATVFGESLLENSGEFSRVYSTHHLIPKSHTGIGSTVSFSRKHNESKTLPNLGGLNAKILV